MWEAVSHTYTHKHTRVRTHTDALNTDVLNLLQALGPKTSIAPSTPDDDKVETANKNKGALYLVMQNLHTLHIVWDFYIVSSE